MTIGFTEPSLSNGGEDIDLLRLLGFEYLEELNRVGLAELIEVVGKDGQPALIAIIPHAKISEGKIVQVDVVGTEIPPANSEGETDAASIPG